MKDSKGESAPMHWTLGYIHKKVEAVKILNRIKQDASYT